MKLFLALFFFATLLFAEQIDQKYKDLKQAVDTISKQLSLEEKVSLYYLILTTHDKITSALSIDESQSNRLVKIQTETLTLITKLTNNKNLHQSQLKNIKNLYLAIIQEVKKTTQTAVKIYYKEKIIYKEKVIQKQNIYILDFLQNSYMSQHIIESFNQGRCSQA